jgi:hypothetical protein
MAALQKVARHPSAIVPPVPFIAAVPHRAAVPQKGRRGKPGFQAAQQEQLAVPEQRAQPASIKARSFLTFAAGSTLGAAFKDIGLALGEGDKLVPPLADNDIYVDEDAAANAIAPVLQFGSTIFAGDDEAARMRLGGVLDVKFWNDLEGDIAGASAMDDDQDFCSYIATVVSDAALLTVEVASILEPPELAPAPSLDALTAAHCKEPKVYFGVNNYVRSLKTLQRSDDCIDWQQVQTVAAGASKLPSRDANIITLVASGLENLFYPTLPEPVERCLLEWPVTLQVLTEAWQISGELNSGNEWRWSWTIPFYIKGSAQTPQLLQITSGLNDNEIVTGVVRLLGAFDKPTGTPNMLAHLVDVDQALSANKFSFLFGGQHTLDEIANKVQEMQQHSTQALHMLSSASTAASDGSGFEAAPTAIYAKLAEPSTVATIASLSSLPTTEPAQALKIAIDSSDPLFLAAIGKDLTKLHGELSRIFTAAQTELPSVWARYIALLGSASPSALVQAGRHDALTAALSQVVTRSVYKKSDWTGGDILSFALKIFNATRQAIRRDPVGDMAGIESVGELKQLAKLTEQSMALLGINITDLEKHAGNIRDNFEASSSSLDVTSATQATFLADFEKTAAVLAAQLNFTRSAKAQTTTGWVPPTVNAQNDKFQLANKAAALLEEREMGETLLLPNATQRGWAIPDESNTKVTFRNTSSPGPGKKRQGDPHGFVVRDAEINGDSCVLVGAADGKAFIKKEVDKIFMNFLKNKGKQLDGAIDYGGVLTRTPAGHAKFESRVAAGTSRDDIEIYKEWRNERGEAVLNNSKLFHQVQPDFHKRLKK